MQYSLYYLQKMLLHVREITHHLSFQWPLPWPLMQQLHGKCCLTNDDNEPSHQPPRQLENLIPLDH